jgi:acyl carrier protein
MTRKEIKVKVIEKIQESTITTDEKINEKQIIDDLGYDSLESLELVLRLESEFNIGIPDEDLKNFQEKTIGELINYLDNVINHQ